MCSENCKANDYGHKLDLLPNHLALIAMCFISYEKWVQWEKHLDNACLRTGSHGSLNPIWMQIPKIWAPKNHQFGGLNPLKSEPVYFEQEIHGTYHLKSQPCISGEYVGLVFLAGPPGVALVLQRNRTMEVWWWKCENGLWHGMSRLHDPWCKNKP